MMTTIIDTEEFNGNIVETVIKIEEPQLFSVVECEKQCEKCDYTASNPLALDIHNNFIHPTLEPPFYCPHCAYQTTTKRLFKRHLVRHVPKEFIKLHQCLQCNFKAKRREEIQQHIQWIHISNNSIYCPQCRKGVMELSLKKERICLFRCNKCCYQCTKTKLLKGLKNPSVNMN